jgi:hypothetical protein
MHCVRHAFYLSSGQPEMDLRTHVILKYIIHTWSTKHPLSNKTAPALLETKELVLSRSIDACMGEFYYMWYNVMLVYQNACVRG